MPDISLLQEDFRPEEEESRIPSIFLTSSVLLLMVSIISYVGLVFYVSTTKQSLDQVVVSIKNLNIDSASNSVSNLNGVEVQLNALKELKNMHTNSNVFLSIVANSVHPDVYYESGSFDLRKKTINLIGVAEGSVSLSGQVEIYKEDENIESYNITDVAIGDDGVGFTARINVKINNSDDE